MNEYFEKIAEDAYNDEMSKISGATPVSGKTYEKPMFSTPGSPTSRTVHDIPNRKMSGAIAREWVRHNKRLTTPPESNALKSTTSSNNSLKWAVSQ